MLKTAPAKALQRLKGRHLGSPQGGDVTLLRLIPFMAAMNKCLAPKNKSLDGDKATKNRPHRSLSCRAFVGRNCLTPVCEDKMELEYTLIDCATDLIYGPYETFLQARERAQGFERWEIINRVGNLIDWSPTPSTVLTATEQAA